MSLLARLLGAAGYGATYAPWDDFWFQKDPYLGGGASEAGMPVTPETSMRLSAVYACVTLIADMVGSIPLHVYRRLPNTGKELAPTNPTYPLLHRQPNQRQTSIEWRKMGVAHLLLRGNFYNRIVYDRRGAIAALEPLHPDRVGVSLLASGRRGYLYRPPQGDDVAITQDDMFHVMGLSLDGVTGCSVIEYAREAIGAASAQDGFAARFWRQGAEGHLAFVAPNAMSKEMRKANEEALQAHMGGWRQAHKALLLEGGMKAERISVTARDSQYIEVRKFSVTDIARFFRVPPHLVGETDASTSWGSGIESLTLGFINFTLMPWLVAIEQAADRDVILADDCFAEFNVDGLLRGEALTRAQAHRQYVDGGIKSVNEIRIIENLNPLDGEEFDKPSRAGNIGVTENPGGAPDTTRTPPTPSRRQPPEDTGRAAQIAVEAAARLARKEQASLALWGPRLGGNRAAWVSHVTDFYGAFAGELEAALVVPRAVARAWCADRCAAVLENWQQVSAAPLLALAAPDPEEVLHG
jgi:HK97 family phage portal protein